MSADTQQDSLDVKPKLTGRGGPRPGSGRPKGTVEPQTIERMEALQRFRSRVAKSVDKLYAAQLSLATGVQMLFRIEIDEKGKESKPEMVSDQEEIQKYLAGDFTEDHAKYYFLATERPNNQAIDSLMDRTFGKAQQNVKVEDERPNPLLEIMEKYGLSVAKTEKKPAESDNKDTNV